MRVAQGLSLRQLADRSGTSFAYLAQVERGEKAPTDRWLRPVLEALADSLDRPRGAA